MLSGEELALIITAVASLLGALGFKAWSTGKKATTDVQPLMDKATASRNHIELQASAQASQQLQVKHYEDLRKELRDLRDKLVEIETALRYSRGD